MQLLYITIIYAIIIQYNNKKIDNLNNLNI